MCVCVCVCVCVHVCTSLSTLSSILWQFEPVTGDMETERKKALEILDKMQSKQPVLDVNKVHSSDIGGVGHGSGRGGAWKWEGRGDQSGMPLAYNYMSAPSPSLPSPAPQRLTPHQAVNKQMAQEQRTRWVGRYGVCVRGRE